MPNKNIDGINIEYEIIGQGEPILALMPGARRGYLEMMGLAEKIAKNNIRVLLHDRRNTGKSDLLIDDSETEEITCLSHWMKRIFLYQDHLLVLEQH